MSGIAAGSWSVLVRANIVRATLSNCKVRMMWTRSFPTTHGTPKSVLVATGDRSAAVNLAPRERSYALTPSASVPSPQPWSAWNAKSNGLFSLSEVVKASALLPKVLSSVTKRSWASCAAAMRSIAVSGTSCPSPRGGSRPVAARVDAPP